MTYEISQCPDLSTTILLYSFYFAWRATTEYKTTEGGGVRNSNDWNWQSVLGWLPIRPMGRGEHVGVRFFFFFFVLSCTRRLSCRVDSRWWFLDSSFFIVLASSVVRRFVDFLCESIFRAFLLKNVIKKRYVRIGTWNNPD